MKPITHTITYYAVNYSLVAILVLLAVAMFLVVLWALLGIWREEEQIRRDRRAEHQRAEKINLPGKAEARHRPPHPGPLPHRTSVWEAGEGENPKEKS
jgi:hypothetical protein